MKTLSLLVCLLVLSIQLSYSQTGPKPNQDTALKKLVLLSEVKSLALEIPKLDGPLARGLADAEVADAAWTLDREWAKSILKEGYRLTYPTEEEQSKLKPQTPGTDPLAPTEIGRARSEVRRRILSVARRDKAFADQLIQDASAHVNRDDKQMMYAQLARMALNDGDNEAASRSIQDNMAIDPTQIVFVDLVNDLAMKDRAAADKLIIQCMANLSALQQSDPTFNVRRADVALTWLMFPNSFFPDASKRIPNPGPEASRAYVSYVIESLTTQVQRDPGGLRRERSFLLSAWLFLNTYAPELKARFMQLEALSRTPGKDSSLPTQSYEEADKERFRKRDNDALNSDQPNDVSIGSLISREDFDTARKLISKLPDGARKDEFIEQVNTREAISLVKKGDLIAAQSLAERLTRASSMLQVYPLIVQRHAANNDQTGSSMAVHQALRQLKSAETKPGSANTQSFGMPASFAPSATEIDPVLSSLGKLTKAILPLDTSLAFEVIDELVVRANAGQIDTKQGRTGIDSEIFNELAAKDEIRAHSAAENFKDRLRRIVALAAIYRWKAKELENDTRNQAVRTARPTPP